MVNFDIWWPNIICNRENGEIKYAWIDPERSFWGDRIADFVCLEYQKPLEKKKASLAAYNAVADEPIRVTREEKIRYAVMQGDRKSTRLNSSHPNPSRMPSSA